MKHRTRLKVRFGDVDLAGIVYFPRFLHYCHVGMEDYFSKVLGIDYDDLLLEHRLAFPTVHIEIDFLRPLKYGEKVEIEMEIKKIGHTSVEWRYRIFRVGESEAIAASRHVTVCTNLDSFEKRQFPDWLRRRLGSEHPAAKPAG
ncbi:MAG: acyl-CoA thioesterase [Thermoanaerobaculia bacterium]